MDPKNLEEEGKDHEHSVTGEKKKKKIPVVCCAIGEGIVGQVAATGECRYAADVYKDPYFSASVDAVQGTP